MFIIDMYSYFQCTFLVQFKINSKLNLVFFVIIIIIDVF